MARNEEQIHECPLCMEVLEIDDVNFFPCSCGYQVCRFCWHRIRTDENGLCPACRKHYSEDPADFKPVPIEEVQRIKNEKKQKDLQRKQKVSDNRKSLAKVRVVQKNLVFVLGLPPRLADTEILKKQDYFEKFGKIQKLVVNNSTTYAGSQIPSASAYVTFYKPEDALHAVKALNSVQIDGRYLKASLGTTKYCSHFLKNQLCPKSECMYLHELGDDSASFTKEEMQQGKHQEYEKILMEQILDNSTNRKHIPVNRLDATEMRLSSSSENSNSSTNSQTKAEINRKKHIHDDCHSSQEKYSSLDKENYLSQEIDSEQWPQLQNSNSHENICSSKKLVQCHKEISRLSPSNIVKQNNIAESDNEKQYGKDNIYLLSSSSSSRESLLSDNSDSQEKSDTDSSNCKMETTLNSYYQTSESNRELKSDNTPPPINTRSTGSSPTMSIFNFSENALSSSSSQIPFNFPSNIHQQSELQYRDNAPPGFKRKACDSLPETHKISGPKDVFNIPYEWQRNYNSNLPILSDNIPSNDEQNKIDTNWVSSHVKLQDDDLGFDPWYVSSKGLADLMEEEEAKKIRSTNFGRKETGSTNLQGIKVPANNCSFPQFRTFPRPPPGFNQLNYNISRLPSHNRNLQQSTVFPTFEKHTMGLNRSGEMYSDNMWKPNIRNNFMPNSIHSEAYNSNLNGFQNMKDIQKSLKSLLPPNINIKFGPMYSQSPRLPPGLILNQKASALNSNRPEYSWLQDPAIISSGAITNNTM